MGRWAARRAGGQQGEQIDEWSREFVKGTQIILMDVQYDGYSGRRASMMAAIGGAVVVHAKPKVQRPFSRM